MADPVRYYFDQHMDPAVAAGLKRRGVDVVSAQDAGRCGYDDPAQLAYAAAVGRVLVTFDTDYLALHAAGVPHTGIAWAHTAKYTIGGLVSVLLLVHAVYAADDMRNHLEYL